MSVGEYNPSDIAKLLTMQRKDQFLGSFAEQELNRRTTLHKELRAYEVSLWTLLDEFITVLKWSDVEQLGRIQSPKMTLNVDGTQKLTFSMPMYLYTNKDELKYFYSEFLNTNEINNSAANIHLRENPIWYSDSIKNKLPQTSEWMQIDMGNLITSMRKIKVIFNKGEEHEITDITLRQLTRSSHTFEFIITKVTEEHDSDKLMCEVESEGLAFHELGKIGYKISLSLDNFALQYNDWKETGKWKKTNRIDFDDEETDMPLLTLDYWCEEAGLIKLPSDLTAIDPRTWYYDVRMDWSSFSDCSERNSDLLYEEPYTTSWNTETLAPLAVASYRVKARSVTIDKSNLYNITLTIAETFEVFCRYEYIYDDNYHIIGRVVVFYNNFIQEDPTKVVSFTYPYSSSKIFRTMESENITTKLHVTNVDNSTILEGYNSIINAQPNASREDYILNFDYMYAIGAITLEQYELIKNYEIKMRKYNDDIALLLQKKSTYESLKIEAEAKKTVAENSMKLDEEQCAANQALKNALDILDGDADGYILLSANNPDLIFITTDVYGAKSINMKNTNKGILASSIKIFNKCSISNSNLVLTDPITSFEIETDDNNNITSIKLLNLNELNVSTGSSIDWAKVFLDYYLPENYKGNVKLINRPIVPKAVFEAAEYEEFEGTYGTLYSSSFTPLGANDSPRSDDGKFYDIVYTPVKVNGEVVSESDIITYLDGIIAGGTNPATWMSIDAKLDKLLLGYFEIANKDDHTASDAWTNELHNKQEEWDKIRAKNNWFGEASNPYNVEIEALDDYSNLTFVSSSELNDYTNTESTTTTKVYLTYKYSPLLYYDNIIKTWQIKWAEDNTKYMLVVLELGPKSDETGYATSTGLYKKIDDLTSSIKEELFNKLKEIDAFNHMMGPAIREGYWQPEDYDDYGDRNIITGNFTDTPITDDSGTGAIIGWDTLLFDEEEKLSYQAGVSETVNTEYYPCIDLVGVFGSLNDIPDDLSEYSLVWKATNDAEYSNDPTTIKNLKIYAIGTSALIRFINVKVGSTTIYKPVLVVLAASSLPEDLITRMTNSSIGAARLEKYSVTVTTDDSSGAVVTTVNVSHGELGEIKSIGDNWISDLSSKSLIYPRIKFSSLDLKTNSNDLVIKYNDHILSTPEDYRINTRDTLRNELYYLEYYITIKPETLIKYKMGDGQPFNIDYVISNANTSIYLDALKVSKENAWPKVSYTIDVNSLDTNLLRILYSKLAQIVMINDVDLKFKNVFGYISQLELDLDLPQNDSIEVKNYKTKFEDLFSTIVAQTEEMKRNGAGFIAAASGEVPLTESTLATTLNLNYSILLAYIDSGFDTSEVVRNKLAEIFDEAGLILASSNKTLNSMHALTLENADILAGFARNVREELSGLVYKSSTRPANFKQNDVWILTDENGNVIGRYLATSSSENSSGEGTAGFVRTYDGTLASITGSSLNIDAEAGTIDIEALNLINIKSGNSIYIAANENVEIVGNKKVNIGGTEINLCTLVEKLLNPLTGMWETVYSAPNTPSTKVTTGINLIAGEYRADGDYPSDVSRILIHPDKLSIGSSELELIAASKMNFISSAGLTNNTSAIHISSDDGIWIGTGTTKGVRIFSGDVLVDKTTGNLVTSVTGASVELNSEHLILGFSHVKNSSGTAIEMTEDSMIIAAGNSINHNDWESGHAYIIGDMVIYNNIHYRCKTAHTSTGTWDSSKWTEYGITGTSTGLVGAKFTKDSIGFATGSGNSINAILMDNNGVSIGSGGVDLTKDSSVLKTETETNLTANSITDGSYVRIGSGGIELGSLADLYINTTNFKLLTHSRDKGNTGFENGETIMAVGNNLLTIGYNTEYDPTLFNNTGGFKNGSTVIGTANDKPDVRLLVNKNGAYIKGTVYADAGSFTGNVDASSFIAHGANGYFIANDTKFGLYETDGTTGILTIDNSGNINAAGDLKISAGKNIYIGTSTTDLLYDANGAASTAVSTYKTGLENGTYTVNSVSNTGIDITSTGIALKSTATISLTANNSIFIGSSSSNSAVLIDNTGITLGSNKNLIVDTTNVKINPAATPTNAIFYVGSSDSKYIKYFKDSNGNGTLEVKGNIYAKAGIIGNYDNINYEDVYSNNVLQYRKYQLATDIESHWLISSGIILSSHAILDEGYDIPGHDSDSPSMGILSSTRMIADPRVGNDLQNDAWTMGVYTCRMVKISDDPNDNWYRTNVINGTEDIINYSFFTHGGTLVSNHPRFSTLFYMPPGADKDKEISLAALADLVDHWDIGTHSIVSGSTEPTITPTSGITAERHNGSWTVSSNSNITRTIAVWYTFTQGTVAISTCSTSISISIPDTVSNSGNPQIRVLAFKADGNTNVITSNATFSGSSTITVTLSNMQINAEITKLQISVTMTAARTSSTSGTIIYELNSNPTFNS